MCDRIIHQLVRTVNGRHIAAYSRPCTNLIQFERALIRGNPGEPPFTADVCSTHLAEEVQIQEPPDWESEIRLASDESARLWDLEYIDGEWEHV